MDLALATAIVLACTGLAVGALLLIRRRAPKGGYYTDSQRSAGVQAVLGTAFSVLLAFVIFLAFQSYNGADEAAGVEAVSVKEQFEAAELFTPRDRELLQGELVCYGRAVADHEWTVMRDGGRSELVDDWVLRSERTLHGVEQGNYRERTAFDKWFDEEAARDQARSTRLLEGQGVIPSPLWLVLLLGAAVLIGFMLLFADPTEGRGAQAMLIGTVTALVVTSLLVVDFLDHPYREGAGSLDPDAMEQGVGEMEGELGALGRSVSLPCDSSGVRGRRLGPRRRQARGPAEPPPSRRHRLSRRTLSACAGRDERPPPGSRQPCWRAPPASPRARAGAWTSLRPPTG